ncbi:hypothetical protein P8452_77997 [Trifolium repens]|nr:hypothetical protein P8452_77997 [Trifolium repens]
MERSYHAIKDINKKKEVWKLAVIVDELWSAFKGDKEDTLEMLLRDINGDTIHATINTNDISAWKDKISQGKTYYMNNFRVGVNDHKFKMSQHACKLTFVAATRVHELDIPAMPTTLFMFKDFGEILSGNYEPDVLVDAIGVVQEIGKCVSASSTKKGNVAFKMMNKSEHLLDCTLWDALAAEFLERYNNRTDFGPFVLIINHARVKEAQGIYPLQLSNVWNGTKLLFDENIPEIKEFKSSFPKNANYSTQSAAISNFTQGFTQGSVGSQYNSDELFMSRAKVLSLAEMKLLKTDTFCVTVLETSHVRTNGGGWFFRGCRECNKKVDGTEAPFACIDGHKTDDPLIKYKLDVEVCDGDEEAKFVFWDSSLDELIGMPASELLKKQHERGIFEDTDYPDEFEDIMHRTFAFRVKWQWSWGHGSVIQCKDDKDLVAKIQEQLPNAETKCTEAVPVTPTDQNTLATPEAQSKQVFTTEDIAKFSLLDDNILSTPICSASAETDPAVSSQNTPAKRFVKQKTTDHVLDGQLSSSRGRKIIKKEK